MKWLVLIVVLGAVGWAGYQWLDDFMARQTLGAAIEAAIDDPRSRSPDQMRVEIRQAAQQLGITLEPSQVELEVISAAAQPMAGQVVATGGLLATSRQLTVRVRYDRRLWGQLRPVLIERTKVYIAAAAAPQGPQERLLQRVP